MVEVYGTGVVWRYGVVLGYGMARAMDMDMVRMRCMI